MEQPDKLLRKFRDNQCSEQEILYLLDLFSVGKDESTLKDAISNCLDDVSNEQKDTDAVLLTIYNNLSGQIRATSTQTPNLPVQESPVIRHYRKYQLWQKIGAVAVLLIMLSTGFYFYRLSRPNDADTIELSKNDIAPGGNKASLTLSDGQIIDLSNAKNGALRAEQGISILKNKDGQLVYTVSASAKNRNSHTNAGGQKNVAYHIITTPRGGEYQINLPDGTRIWLNAASSIKFPVSFDNLSERKVQLSGEAYFEVAKNKKKPFRVLSNQQLVEVLGTHFDINSYTQEGSTKTTLLEGLVKVTPYISNKTNAAQVIHPGQQSVISLTGIAIQQADVEEVMGWQKGEFVFNNQPLKDIMYNLSRWYDVDIIYQDEALRNEVFSGVITRFSKISEVLRMLELTEHVQFKIEGRRIIVKK